MRRGVGATFALLASAVTTVAAPSTLPVLQLEQEIGGLPLRIAARTEAEQDLSAAADAVRHASRMVGGPGSVVARLNAAAGDGPQPAPPELIALIERAVDFCRWSENRFGPLAGRLNGLWENEGGGLVARPSVSDRRDAVSSARCDGASVDSDGETVTLAEGVAIDLRGFALGFAIDRAVESLRERRVTAGRVAFGTVQRAFGSAGPSDEGWPLVLPLDPEVSRHLAAPRLRDTAVAVVTEERGLQAPGRETMVLIDHTTGLPVDGMLAVAAASELAVDAEALATTLFITGSRLGSFLLGRLRPTPSAIWLLGQGEGQPLVTDYRWSRLGRAGGRW